MPANSVFSVLTRIVAIAVVTGVFAQSFSTACYAQSGEDVAKGLLRALIESQLQKSQRRSEVAPPPNSLRPPNGRGVPGHPQVTPQMQQLRVIAAGFSQEMATLSALLQTDSHRNVEVRRMLPDVIRVQAAATALSQRSTAVHNHLLVMDDFRNLNSEWSVLSHQLEHRRSVSPQAKSCMQRIAALDSQYCSLLGLQEQFNSQDLTRAVYTLTTYVRDITDDVQDRPQPGAAHHELVREMGQFGQRVEYFAALVSRGTAYSAVVSEYRSLYTDWGRIEGRLSGYSGPGIARTVRRIQDTNRTIHQLLRIELGIDKNQVLNLVHSIDHDMQELCRRITLEHLISLPDGPAIPATADAVLGTLQNLDDLVHRDESSQSIGEAWVFADDAWKQFLYYTGPVKDPAIMVGLRGISSSMTSLKQTLGVTVEYDQELLVSNASTLENHAERLLDVIKRWQRRSGAADQTLQGQAESLVAAFHGLEQSLASRRRSPKHSQQCDQAVVIWQQLRPTLKTCDTDERGELEHIAATLTPELVRLSTMLAE